MLTRSERACHPYHPARLPPKAPAGRIRGVVGGESGLMVEPFSQPGAFVLLAVHAGATWTMVGVIWTCQLVHYPLFAQVAPVDFVAYERAHMRRISLIVGPAMLVELGAAIAIVVLRPGGVPLWLATLGLGLVGVNAVSTAVLQGPTHQRLAEGFDAERIRFLVASNWIRTAAWSLRGVSALAMLGWA